MSFIFLLGDSDISVVEVRMAVRGLVGMVLLFDVYAVYQQAQLSSIRKQLFEREELFRLISENAADMIAVVDGKGKRLYNSPAYERILGYSSDELKDTSAFEQIHPQDQSKVQKAAEEALRSGVGQRLEYRMRHKDGSWRQMESTASAVRSERGQIERLVIVNRDVTAQRKLEEQFRQSQKMEAIGQLSGGVAHDFNNLLGVIIGYTEFLEEKLPAEGPLCTCVSEILQAGRRAAALTRQLLAFSRQQVLEPRVLELNRIVLDMKKLLCRLIGEDIELSSVLEADLGNIKADESQIEQILLNLAVNARDAMPEGGKLMIETSNVEIDDTVAKQYPYPVQPGRYVQLMVSDTGVGMDSATRSRIFEPFFTTKEKGRGTGLGLSVVYGVVKQSGGYITVYSEPGSGTTFKICLPRVDQAIRAAQLVPNNAGLEGRETILLVEDEPSLRSLTRLIIDSYGYTVLEAEDGEKALALSRNHTGPIQLLLTDVVMPGISGRMLAEKLATTFPNVRVLFMSGYTGQRVGGIVIPEGSHFIQKPFTREALARKMREVLDRKFSSDLPSCPTESLTPCENS
jgi:PAS domain S-box-containing protein